MKKRAHISENGDQSVENGKQTLENGEYIWRMETEFTFKIYFTYPFKNVIKCETKSEVKYDQNIDWLDR